MNKRKRTDKQESIFDQEKRLKKEAKELQDMIRKEGKNFKLQPWDWRFTPKK